MSDEFEKRTAKLIPFDYAQLYGGDDPVTICLRESQQKALLAQAKYAQWRKRWQNGDAPLTEAEWHIAHEWADDLIVRLMGDENCTNARECEDYPPNSSIADIQPSNPYVDPEYVPDGYLSPAFWTLTGYDPVWSAVGIQIGDLMTDATHFPGGGFPPAPISSGFARVRVTVRGGDELEVHFVGFPILGVIPGAGYVMIVKNDDPLTLETYDLNVDIVNVPPEIGEVTIWQWDVEGDPEIEQHVDITFMPSLGDEFIPFRYGGGIRKFTLCRDVNMLEDVRQNPDNPCILEKKMRGGDWETFAELDLCAGTGTGTGGVSIEDVLGDIPEGYDPPGELPQPVELGEEISDPCCYVSSNAAACIKRAMNDIQDSMTGVVTLTEFLLMCALILAALFSMAFLAAAIAIVFGATAISWQVFRQTTTNAHKKQLACILYSHCEIDEITNYPTFDVPAILAEIEAIPYYTGNVWGGIWVLVTLLQNNGLKYLGSLPADPEATCDDCGCIGWYVDYRIWDNDIEDMNGNWSATGGHSYITGQGIGCVAQGGTTRGMGVVQYGGNIVNCNRMRVWFNQPQNVAIQMWLQIRQADGSWLTLYNWLRSNAGVGDGWSAYIQFSPGGITGEVRMIFTCGATNATTVLRAFEVGSTTGAC